LNLDLAYSSFPYFARVIGEDVMVREELRQNETFVFKDFHYNWAKNMQERKRYAIVAFRKSMKSTMLRLRAMWKLYRLMRGEPNPEYEGLYLSAKEDLAAKHTAKLKRYIMGSPLFKDCVHETDAESIIKMRLPNKKRYTITPGGILAAHRGDRPDEVFVDDILGDVSDQASMVRDITMINKITDLFLQTVQYLPRLHGAIFVAGTPQTDNDIFAVLEGAVEEYEESLEGNDWLVERLSVEDAKGHSVMPEVFPDERLAALRGAEGSRQDIAYQKEMKVRPGHQVFRTFFPKRLIEACIKKEQSFRQPQVTVGGLDMGKRKHPGHLAIFEPHSGKLTQVLSRWFDRCEYRKMVAEASRYCEYFNCVSMGIDNTRADFEGFYEQGYVLLTEHDEAGNELSREILKLHPAMTPIMINTSTKWPMAQRMRSVMEVGRIEYLPDLRQKRQLLLIDQQLHAAETQEGHGEPFTSIGFAVQAAFEQGFLTDDTVHQHDTSPLSDEELTFKAFQECERLAANDQSGGPGTVRL